MTLDEEREKANHAHNLEVKRILLDKLLFGVLIVLTGLIANMIFEGYKSDLAKTQFLLERRLEALKDLRVSFSKLSHHAFAEAFDAGAPQAEAYAQEVGAFFHLINRWAFLFSEDFNRDLTHHAWIHQAIAAPDVKLTQEHWGFIVDVAEAFDTATRTALNVEVLGTPPQSQSKQFKIQVWKSEDVRTKGTAQFFQDNFNTWQKERPQGSPQKKG